MGKTDAEGNADDQYKLDRATYELAVKQKYDAAVIALNTQSNQETAACTAETGLMNTEIGKVQDILEKVAALTGDAAGVQKHLTCGPCTGEVSMYDHAGFTGRVGHFSAGDHNIDAVRTNGFTQMTDNVGQHSGNDKLSSLVVPEGCKVTLYQHGNYRGYDGSFGPGRYDTAALTAGGVKNNDVSSLKVK